jgi:hypothetical protein
MNQNDKREAAPTRAYLSTTTFAVVIAAQCVVFAAALRFVATHAPAARTAAADPPQALIMATCSGSVDETPDESPWAIPLDRCDKTIDGMEIKSAFLQKWTICGGADSFAISSDPRRVMVTGDHIHCSKIKSEVSVTYLGFAKN